MKHPTPVILSGSADSQLWPLSRDLTPKQFLELTASRTPLQETALRLDHPPIVVCSAEHRFIVAEQLGQIDVAPLALVIEPVGRGTAPAAAVAALILADMDPDALMLLMPSDHLVGDPAALRRAVEVATMLAESGAMVAFGITATTDNPAYGYIRIGKPLAGGYRVDRFVEKPGQTAAREYLASAEYCWNSGIYLLPVGLYLAELEAFAPGTVALCRDALAQGRSESKFIHLDDQAFAQIPAQSIDHAVMEHSSKLAAVPVDMGWSDIGSWAKLWRESPRDGDDNAIIGDVVALQSSGCYLRSEDRLLTAIGLTDLVVVVTDDAVLVTDKAHEHDIGTMVTHLKQDGRAEVSTGTRGWRPWGWFETIEEGERFKVKQIHVEPGGKLSLQKHWHRSEHWVVVKGTAMVTRGETTHILRENESIFIPATMAHRLENPGRVPLLLIEVQSGEYVGEDDIVRMDDVYGRSDR
ncbi:mannose-1-phosphate guanylyltransferase/mannose-6-phosphate isomerase [Magnetospirillum moscoviense]|uniref:mannose-1-phosphate guanylyltransferase n=1 Tax=Magnetospirillum moscoviense TaxID=1437059 RepID=A0A178MTX3_9PROT|nr:mannose-1-phosphate guanylyltransferase/mannose-6-phosphate isomerase [Magnetospirillum moscoviense]MBF0324528.1 mannose-1-phosphate guanylyltransferase/mannose-6-phosphate isomerase [Alphaproteobacteria bacterium]OAN51551.1 mannose-1-phosphate guanylyltransferase/mannose-6-phosphate isomerase [Magnetospirillum moscoviense]